MSVKTITSMESVRWEPPIIPVRVKVTHPKWLGFVIYNTFPHVANRHLPGKETRREVQRLSAQKHKNGLLSSNRDTLLLVQLCVCRTIEFGFRPRVEVWKISKLPTDWSDTK